MRRRDLLVAVSLLSGCAGRRARPALLRIGMIPEENESRMARYEVLAKHLGSLVHATPSLQIAVDYAGVIEALKSGHLELARMGPASYAKSWLVMKGQIEPIAAAYDTAGNRGTYSVIVVRANGPIHDLQDLRGKALAVADPNSTTSYQAPIYYLRKQGIDAEKFFSKMVFSGNHENAVLSVVSGTYEAAGTWWMSEARSRIRSMELRKMIPENSLRIVWKSPIMASSPWAIPKRVDPAWKDEIRKALINMKNARPDVWKSFSDGTEGGFYAVRHEDYLPIIEMIQENQEARHRA